MSKDSSDNEKSQTPSYQVGSVPLVISFFSPPVWASDQGPLTCWLLISNQSEDQSLSVTSASEGQAAANTTIPVRKIPR